MFNHNQSHQLKAHVHVLDETIFLTKQMEKRLKRKET